jgi:hypothetical protein
MIGALNSRERKITSPRMPLPIARDNIELLLDARKPIKYYCFAGIKKDFIRIE